MRWAAFPGSVCLTHDRAQELQPGEIVNLGIGIPNLIPDFLGVDSRIVLHTENYVGLDSV